MKLYLVRHGEYQMSAQQRDELTTQGKQEIEKLAHFLKPLNIHVDHIFHSNKFRAKQTAELLAPSIDCKQAIQELPGLGPEDDVRPIKDSLGMYEGNLMLVGHLPFMSKLVGKLMTGNEDKELVIFYPGTMACLEGEDVQWEMSWILTTEFFKHNFNTH